MFKRRYKRLFPQTFAVKNFSAPYNNRIPYRLQASLREDKDSDFVRKFESESKVCLNELTDYSSDNTDLHLLLLEAGKILKNTTDALGVQVYIVHQENREMYLVTGQPEIMVSPYYRFAVEKGRNIPSHVAFTREYVLVEDLKNDLRFPDGAGFQSFADCVVGSVLCVPVVSPEGKSFAVFELQKSEDQEPFDIDDLKIVIVLSGWMGSAMYQNMRRIAIKKQETIHDRLLKITTSYFKEHTSFSKMLTDLVALAKDTLDVSRGSFYVVDKDKEDLTTYVYEESVDERKYQLIKKNIPVEPIKKDRGIVSIVARSGYTINVKNPSRDPRIGKEPELKTGRSIKSMLCMPIIGHSGLVGIFKLLNKRTGYFNKKDEAVLKTFGLYASCCLHNNIMIERLKKQVLIGNMREKSLSMELRPCQHERFVPKSTFMTPPGFSDFRWYVTETALQQAPEFVVHMIRDLSGLDNTDYTSLADFILVTRRLYRNNPYHNFEHAFNFMHCMYNILKRNLTLFTPIEMKALLISSICHDIDHGGCTNNFLQICNDVIYQLYETSSWENYHYFITEKLLQKYDIFKFNDKNMNIFMREVRDAILATDLQQHLRSRKMLYSLIKKQSFDYKNTSHMGLLKGLMMTVCDLSAQCKPFHIAKRITMNVYGEFYGQGDREKLLGIIPLSMMDRDKQHLIAGDQIHFIAVIVSPATEILSILLPNTIELNAECRNLQSNWQEIMNSESNTVLEID